MEEITILAINDKPGGGLRVLRQLGDGFIMNGKKVNYIFSNFSGSNFFDQNDAEYYYPIKKNFKNIFLIYASILLTVIYCKLYFSKSKIIVSDPFFMPFIWFLYGCEVHRFCQADDAKLFENNFQKKSRLFFFLFNYLYKKFENLGSNFPYRKIHFSTHTLKKIFRERYTSNKITKRISEIIIYPRIEDIFFKDFGCEDNKKYKFTVGAILRSHSSKRAIDFINLAISFNSEKFTFKAVSFKDEIKYVEEMIKNLNATRKIDLITAKNDIKLADFYSSLDFFISSSEFEGFGLPALEAMASGKIVITAENDGIMTYAEDRINSLIFKPRNIEALKSILEEMADNIQLQKLISSNAIKTAHKFTIESLSQDLNNF